MPSESDSLSVVTVCDYLTEVGVKWRQSDWNAMKMVKALKGDEINGTFEAKVNGTKKTFSQSNASEFVDLIPSAMYKAIRQYYDGAATIVPIPNSHVVSPDAENFKTLGLANAIAKLSDGSFTAVPALVFREPQVKSRSGGPRSPLHFEKAYRVVEAVEGPIILIDDVCTLGGHLIGACWKLSSSKRDIVLGCAFGSTTKEQSEKPLSFKKQELSLERGLADFAS